MQNKGPSTVYYLVTRGRHSGRPARARNDVRPEPGARSLKNRASPIGLRAARPDRRPLLITTSIIVDGPFCTPFLQGPFIASLLPLQKSKKGSFTVFRRKNDFFTLVISLQKREIFSYFCFFFQIFYVFNKKSPTYL